MRDRAHIRYWAATAACAVFSVYIVVETLLYFLRSLGLGPSGAVSQPGIALAGAEILAAALFAWPRTNAIGAVGLLAVFAIAGAHHLLKGEMPAVLALYAGLTVLFYALHRLASRHRPG